MEQQTISIAKAGITTMLKARTSVLAAANPPSGRYDDLAALEDNIELQTTILSRFDLIFIVKDNRTRERDEMIAKHVLDIHRKGGQLKTNSGVCCKHYFLHNHAYSCLMQSKSLHTFLVVCSVCSGTYSLSLGLCQHPLQCS